MRTYYIFFIKNDIYKITKNKTEVLYKLLESIKYLNKNEINLGFKVFEKLCDRVPKKNINKLIKDDFIDNLSYNIFKDTHVINDFINNESTKLTVYSSHLVIKSNALFPEFFNTLSKLNNLFACDFENMDYFYIRNVKIKVSSK